MPQFAQKLEHLAQKSRLRVLQKPAGIDLTSNDYLGLRTPPALRQAAIEALERGIDLGAGGSRLLRGIQNITNLWKSARRRFSAQKRRCILRQGFKPITRCFRP